MKKRLALWMICPWLLTTGALSSCESFPIKVSASYDIHAEGMKEPVRVEIGYWNVRMTGKETREVQPVQ